MLNESQLAVLKANIMADPTLAAYAEIRADARITEAYNAVASPSFVVWKPDVRPSEIPAVFTWTEIDALTNGKARIWEWMRLLPVLDCRIANVRQGLSDAFSAATNTKAAALAFVKRNALRGERLFATGTGSDASPGLLVVVGNLTDTDIDKALRLP